MVINQKNQSHKSDLSAPIQRVPPTTSFQSPTPSLSPELPKQKPTFSSLLYKTKKHKASFCFEFHFWLHCPSLLTLLPDSSELPWLLSPDPMSLPSNPPPNSAVPLIVINSLISFGNGLRFAAESDRVRPGLASAASTAHRKARFLRLVKS